LFYRNGEYSISNEKQVTLRHKKSIHNLNIDSIRKRKGDDLLKMSEATAATHNKKKEVTISLIDD
jgi:hypothetical protein